LDAIGSWRPRRSGEVSPTSCWSAAIERIELHLIHPSTLVVIRWFDHA